MQTESTEAANWMSDATKSMKDEIKTLDKDQITGSKNNLKLFNGATTNIFKNKVAMSKMDQAVRKKQQKMLKGKKGLKELMQSKSNAESGSHT